MRPSERGAALLAALVAAGVALAVILAGGWLGRQAWLGVLSNVIQVISGPGLILAVGVAAWARWQGRCAMRLCVRHGEHPVHGTQRKVCRHHHTMRHHRLVHAAHRVYGESLTWGESHDRPSR